MIKVYLVSSLKNYALNDHVKLIIESKGMSCFLPQRDALEKALRNSGKNNRKTYSKIQKLNTSGIKNANVVLVLAKNMGIDSSWECGFAAGLGKPVVIIKTPQDPIKDEPMVLSSCQIIEVQEYTIEELKQGINSFDFKRCQVR